MTRAIATLISTLLLFASAAVSAEAPIKTGALYRTSGSAGVFGVPAMVGHDMAVEEINAAGGLLGRPVVTVARDTKLKPATASAAGKELITK